MLQLSFVIKALIYLRIHEKGLAVELQSEEGSEIFDVLDAEELVPSGCNKRRRYRAHWIFTKSTLIDKKLLVKVSKCLVMKQGRSCSCQFGTMDDHFRFINLMNFVSWVLLKLSKPVEIQATADA